MPTDPMTDEQLAEIRAQLAQVERERDEMRATLDLISALARRADSARREVVDANRVQTDEWLRLHDADRYADGAARVRAAWGAVRLAEEDLICAAIAATEADAARIGNLTAPPED